MRVATRSTVTAVWLLGWTLALAGGASADDLRQTWEVAPDVHVDVQIVSGRIAVRGIDASQVRVRARGGDVEAEGSRDFVTLRGPATSWRAWPFGGANVDLEIEVPRGSRITARTINGPIEVEDVEGALDLHAANGEIDVDGAPSEAHLETLNARIEFRGDGSEVVARTLNGEIDLRGVAREVEATTMSGRIRIEGEDIERAELRTMAGDIELDASLAPGARVYGKTYSGQVRLRLPADTSARFDVETFSGGVHSEFAGRIGGDADPELWKAHGPGQRLHFVVGEGDARVAIDSFSGGVRIEEDDGESRERRAERRERRREKLAERRERAREKLEERRERRQERAEEQAERDADEPRVRYRGAPSQAPRREYATEELALFLGLGQAPRREYATEEPPLRSGRRRDALGVVAALSGKRPGILQPCPSWSASWRRSSPRTRSATRV